MQSCYPKIMPASNAQLKQVGRSGQISIGKRYAGKALQVEHRDDGTIVLTPVVAVPESQLWTLEPDNALRIRLALKWAKEHAPKETDVDELVAKAKKHGKKAK
jgi:hypothetical protein